MPVDKNGNDLVEGKRVFVAGTVVALPSSAGAPFTVNLGEGEVPGANVAVHSKHLLLHPEEVAVNGEQAALKRAVAQKPKHKVIVDEEGDVVINRTPGSEKSAASDALVSRAPNDPNNKGVGRTAAGGDSQGSNATPHLTADNQPKLAPTGPLAPAIGGGKL